MCFDTVFDEIYRTAECPYQSFSRSAAWYVPYLHVDPANRLVADSLEAEWNSKLRALNEAQEECERLRRADHLAMDETQLERIAALATRFPRVWQNPETSDRDKKRMVRLLLEDVTLVKRDQLAVHVRFKGGAPLLRKTP